MCACSGQHSGMDIQLVLAHYICPFNNDYIFNPYTYMYIYIVISTVYCLHPDPQNKALHEFQLGKWLVEPDLGTVAPWLSAPEASPQLGREVSPLVTGLDDIRCLPFRCQSYCLCTIDYMQKIQKL